VRERVHAVAVATACAAGAPRRQLTRARPRMGGASSRAWAQPARPGRARANDGGGNAVERVPRHPPRDGLAPAGRGLSLAPPIPTTDQRPCRRNATSRAPAAALCGPSPPISPYTYCAPVAM